MSSTNNLIAAALERHQSGRLADAETLYRQALDRDPDSADALHLLGLISCQKGQYESGARQIAEAVRIVPSSPILHNNLGTALNSLGRFSDAEKCFDEA